VSLAGGAAKHHWAFPLFLVFLQGFEQSAKVLMYEVIVTHHGNALRGGRPQGGSEDVRADPKPKARPSMLSSSAKSDWKLSTKETAISARLKPGGNAVKDRAISRMIVYQIDQLAGKRTSTNFQRPSGDCFNLG
jgi:hypothetical protein